MRPAKGSAGGRRGEDIVGRSFQLFVMVREFRDIRGREKETVAASTRCLGRVVHTASPLHVAHCEGGMLSTDEGVRKRGTNTTAQQHVNAHT